MGFMDRILRTGEGKKVRALADLAPDIGALEPELQALSDEDLRHRTVEFREQLDRGIDLDDLLIPAFATVRDDGRIKVTWTFKSDGRVAPGLYTVEPDGTMIGIWGYGDQVQWEANGELTGTVSPDRIYAMPTPEPDFK